MANFSEHIQQSQKNLKFLEDISSNLPTPYWDWNVTVAYYVGVHLVNSHIADKSNHHYRKHEEILKALSHNLSPSKVPDNIYLAYRHLQNLSRRSRYLINEDLANKEERCNITYSKHFKKSLVHLDALIEYIKSGYSESFTMATVKCIDAKGIGLKNFNVI